MTRQTKLAWADVRDATPYKPVVTFTEDARSNLEVRLDDHVVGWLEDAGQWTWLPDRRNRECGSYRDKTFGRDFEGAKRFIVDLLTGQLTGRLTR